MTLAAGEPSELCVLFRDEDFVVVDKPSGLFVHRTSLGPDRDVALQRLRDQLGRKVYPVHRLDRASSGALLFALSSEATKRGQAALERGHKSYLVLVRGTPPKAWSCDRPLRNSKGEPRPSRTSFATLERFDATALVEALLEEGGRRHQIRRHLNHCAHHVVGDTTHGKGGTNSIARERYGLSRMFLHASQLRLPELGIDVKAPLATELELVLDRARKL